MESVYSFTIDAKLTTLEVAADTRAWQLKQLERQTRNLAELVRDEHAKGEPVQRLAKRAGVTRATIYAWLAETH